METATMQGRETPQIQYRGGGPPRVMDGDGGPQAAPELPPVLAWLNRAVFGVLVVVWAVVGAIVWVPLLIRTMVRLAFAMVPATLDGGHPTEAAEDLRGAVDFYRRGFMVASDAVHGRAPAQTKPARPLRRSGMGRELFWVAAIWYLIFAVFGWVWGPIDIAQWAIALPWAEWGRTALAWVLQPFS